MDRSAGAGFLAELDKQRNSPFRLVEVHMDTGVVYMTNAHRPVSWNGNTYQALGHLLEVGEIEESMELQVSQTTISLSGLDPRIESPTGGSLVAAFLNQDYIDRRVLVYQGYMTDIMGANILEAPIFDGRSDQPTLSEDPSTGVCAISLAVASHVIDFERRPGRHTNHTEQQVHFPGDMGFEFVSEINRQIPWGT